MIFADIYQKTSNILRGILCQKQNHQWDHSLWNILAVNVEKSTKRFKSRNCLRSFKLFIAWDKSTEKAKKSNLTNHDIATKQWLPLIHSYLLVHIYLNNAFWILTFAKKAPMGFENKNKWQLNWIIWQKIVWSSNNW